jgi:hypothetical protein
LKPYVVYWIHIIVITAIMTYGSTVWWPKVTYKVSRKELSKLLRSACLAITERMNVVPTAAIEVLLGPSPLHVMTGGGPGRDLQTNVQPAVET